MIPSVSIFDILDGRFVSTRESNSYQDGALCPDQAHDLICIAVAENPKEVLEIGTFCGHTTLLLAQNLPDAIINTVDLPLNFDVNAENTYPKDDTHLISERVVGREFHNQFGSDRIIQYYGDTATWDFSLAKGSTFFFIDGSHTYDYVKNDTEKCFEICEGKGVFLWRDCDADHPGVVRFLSEWQPGIVLIAGTSLAYRKFE